MNEKERLEALEKKAELIGSGYAGLNRKGQVVDRRENPEATEIQENKMMGNPKPKKDE